MAGDLGGFAESDDAGNVFRAGTNAALVVAAVKQRPQACSAANVKRADALRPVQFVAGKRKQIELELVHINWNFPRGLHGVGVEINVAFFGDPANFLERLNRTELVVGVHDGDKHSFRTKRRLQMLGIN